MSHKKYLTCGSWKSPISAKDLASNLITFQEIRVDKKDVYWLESRPNDGGRLVIMRYSNDEMITEITPPGFNVRTRVHEYGGGAYQVKDGVIYFSNFSDGRVYRQDRMDAPVPITESNYDRFADFILDINHDRLICICEMHFEDGRQPVNSLVSISLIDLSKTILSHGYDFYSSPCIVPEGTKLAWLSWNHPNMPWDGCELWQADFNTKGELINKFRVAGGENESIFQPSWSPGGDLFFISDRSGWWNIYCFAKDEILHICELNAEFGLPQWVFGLSTYGFYEENKIICTYKREGTSVLALIDIDTGKITPIKTTFVDFSYINCSKGNVFFVAGSLERAPEVIKYDLTTQSSNNIRSSGNSNLLRGNISVAQEVSFSSDLGNTFGYYYSPTNTKFKPPPGEKPPLIVMIHGGPTSSANCVFNIRIQYWTTRGFAVLDVNYSGSTGYGRGYRQRLLGKWGIADVNDCINGARHLAKSGLVDSNRMAITGGSAGGYTALCALTFHNVFSAGVSRYGISSLENLAKDTHKFESHYLDKLIGVSSSNRKVYEQRSPTSFIDQITSPILLMQGLEDKVVPSSQSEKIYYALLKNETPVVYLTFEGEGHGFRKAESIIRSIESELFFYSKVFKFEITDPINPIEILNM